MCLAAASACSITGVSNRIRQYSVSTLNTGKQKKKQTLTVYSMHMAYRYKQAYMQKETHLEKKIILLTNGQQKRKYEQKEERKKNT